MTGIRKSVTAALAGAGIMLITTAANAENTSKPLQKVDLELVLAADRSASMSRLMLVKQRNGFAKAFRDETLHHAIRSGPLGRIAVVYVDWSDQTDQTIAIPWTLLETPEDSEQFADAIDGLGVGHPNKETAIGALLFFSKALFDTNRYAAPRQVIDVSGNGRNSDGAPVGAALAALRPHGITVNGLVLPAEDYSTDTDRSLNEYFWREVVSGPGAFVISVDQNRGYSEAILRKLVREVAWNW